MAKIDVLLPVKNGVEYLTESIDSIRAQSFADWRLLILDHGSTDGTVEMARGYCAADRRIELHPFPSADGLSGLLNAGLDLCDSDYVMRHDADDVCYPDRMAISIAAFEAMPDIIALGGQVDMIDGAGANIGEMTLPTGALRVAAAALFRNPVAHPTAMLRLPEMRALGVRYGVDFLQLLPAHQSVSVKGLAEDYLLFGQLSILGKCTNLPNKLIRYRSHGANVSSLRAQEQKEVALSIARFLALSFCAHHALPAFDPAPFCNISGSLFDMEGRVDFEAEFKQIKIRLDRALGKSAELDRELRFRHVVATRSALKLLWRYAAFSTTNTPETGEWNAIRSWLTRRLPGKALATAVLASAS